MLKKTAKTQGYTLMELLVVLAMVGILGAVAMPSFSLQIKQSRLTSSANQLHSVFKFARSEAAKREAKINLVASGNKWQVKFASETLSVYEASHPSITVTGLKDLTISDNGSITTGDTFTITDSDSDTEDYYLCIYISGQSKLSKGTTCQ